MKIWKDKVGYTMDGKLISMVIKVHKYYLSSVTSLFDHDYIHLCFQIYGIDVSQFSSQIIDS